MELATAADRSDQVPPPPSRWWRNALVVALVAATAAGSLWGTDDLWPFAPFRMYATATRLDGTVAKARFVGTTTGGDQLDMPAGWFGLRPAEVEGQLDAATRRLPPGRMADLAAAWNATHPDQPIVRLELHLTGNRLQGGRPVETSDRIVDVWEQG